MRPLWTPKSVYTRSKGKLEIKHTVSRWPSSPHWAKVPCPTLSTEAKANPLWKTVTPLRTSKLSFDFFHTQYAAFKEKLPRHKTKWRKTKGGKDNQNRPTEVQILSFKCIWIHRFKEVSKMNLIRELEIVIKMNQVRIIGLKKIQ